MIGLILDLAAQCDRLRLGRRDRRLVIDVVIADKSARDHAARGHHFDMSTHPMSLRLPPDLWAPAELRITDRLRVDATPDRARRSVSYWVRVA